MSHGQLIGNLRITTSTAKLRRDIATEFVQRLNAVMPARINTMMANLRKFIYNYLSAQLKQEFSDSTLREELGLSENHATAAADYIALTVSNNMLVATRRFRRSGSNVRGGVTVNIGKADHTDLLLNPEAYHFSGNVTWGWLEHLLLLGDQIVQDYNLLSSATTGKTFASSRSGSAIMSKSSRGWRISPQFSGTTNNNIISKILTQSDVTNYIRTQLLLVLSF